jgi:hypothetical protein
MVLQAENSDPATLSGYRHKADTSLVLMDVRCRQVRLQESGDMPFDLRAAVEIMLPMAWQG